MILAGCFIASVASIKMLPRLTCGAFSLDGHMVNVSTNNFVLREAILLTGNRNNLTQTLPFTSSPSFKIFNCFKIETKYLFQFIFAGLRASVKPLFSHTDLSGLTRKFSSDLLTKQRAGQDQSDSVSLQWIPGYWLEIFPSMLVRISPTKAASGPRPCQRNLQIKTQ